MSNVRVKPSEKNDSRRRLRRRAEGRWEKKRKRRRGRRRRRRRRRRTRWCRERAKEVTNGDWVDPQISDGKMCRRSGTIEQVLHSMRQCAAFGADV